MVDSIYHLKPESNWVNDPNGPVFIQGKLHMFYQHNPTAPVWGNMTWGHAISSDMVRWQRLPHALHPDMPYDKDGVFSGCCVIHEGVPHILYTGVYPETLNLAVGDAQGMHFQKHHANPILTAGNRTLKHWRDPYVWREENEYRLLIGGTDENKLGFCELYRGGDLIHWDLIGRFDGASEHALSDAIWECPVVMLSEDCAALFVSVPFHVRTFIGKYQAGRLADGVIGRADLGDSLYAPNLVRHPDGRWLLFGWIRECGDESARAAQGWQGMITLPREISLCDGMLRTRPAAEVDTLRQCNLLHVELPRDPISIQSGCHCEIEAHLDFADGGLVTFDLLRDAEGHCVQILFDGSEIAILRGIYDGGAAKELRTKVQPHPKSKIRIFLDGTCIELFINDCEVLTTRIYPHAPCTGFRTEATGGCKITMLDVYKMGSAFL